MGAPSLDRDGWTVWSGEVRPTGERWLRIDMGRQRTFEAVSLLVSRPESAPSCVVVEISADGDSWQSFGSASVVGERCWIRSSHVTARFVRVGGEGWPAPATDGARMTVADLAVHVADEHHLRRALDRRFGSAAAARLLAAYQETWIGAADLDRIADLGFDLVRVPFAWQMLMDDDGAMRDDASAFGRLDWVVAEAARRGLYVVLDLHAAPGGANPAHFGGQAGSNRLWTDPTAQQMTERLWRAVAARYAVQPAVAGYDLLNEPLAADAGPEDERQLRVKYDLVDRLVRAVRDVDPDHTIFIPAFPSLGVAPPPARYGWTNVVYETHHFGIEAHDDEAGQAQFVRTTLEGLAAARRSSDVPLFVGELWLSDFTPLFGDFVRGLNELGISWANWTYKHKQPAGARFPEGISQGPNWGFFYAGPDAEPDIDHDAAATIEAKWRRYTTDAFTRNDDLADVLGAAAREAR
jgi:hypothetical protein